MKKIARILITVTMLGTALFAPMLFAGTALAQSGGQQSACEGLGGNFNGGECVLPGDQPSIDNVVATVVNVLSIIAGVISVIMIIIAGFRFTTAQGDASTVAAARKTLLFAIIGIVVVAASQLIVRFVLSRIG